MQEHLHIGRMTWKRMGRLYLILGIGAALPFILGLHWRGMHGYDPNLYAGNIVEYDGLFSRAYYTYPDGKFIPLFTLIPPVFRGNIYGMKRIEIDPYHHNPQ